MVYDYTPLTGVIKRAVLEWFPDADVEEVEQLAFSIVYARLNATPNPDGTWTLTPPRGTWY